MSQDERTWMTKHIEATLRLKGLLMPGEFLPDYFERAIGNEVSKGQMARDMEVTIKTAKKHLRLWFDEVETLVYRRKLRGAA